MYVYICYMKRFTMKKFPFLICLIILAGCSKSEVLSPLDDLSLPASDVDVSHLGKKDLILIDDLIQLKISKEEAIRRGVSASEYDLLKETLVKHNEKTTEKLKELGKDKIQTKSSNSITLAWGMLQYPADFYGNVASPFPVSTTGEGDEGITFTYDFAGDYADSGSHTLYYNIGGLGWINEWGNAQGEIPFPGFSFGLVSFEYYYEGQGRGLFLYHFYDNTI